MKEINDEGLVVLQTWKDVEPYVETVRNSSDANRRALGFLPTAVFSGHALRNQLFVAVEGGSGRYLGHLLFDLKTPHATVLQMYADPGCRRRGVARRLIDELKSLLGRHEFLSIRARVAEDLVEANAFWAKAGFVVSKRVAGGETTGRKILVRVLELDTPQLFPVSGLSERGEDNLGLASVESQALPLYLVDLNVLFDVAHQRASHENAVSLLRLAHLGEYRVAISDEAGRELKRTALPGHPDPMRGVIESIPRAALRASDVTDKLIEDLAAIVFPEKSYPAALKRNDLSDVRHLATAITHKAAGFVTRDERVVRVADQLKKKYGVNVLSVTDFLRPIWNEDQKIQLDVSRAEAFEICRYADEDATDVARFLLAQRVPSQDVTGKWIPVSSGERLGKRVIARAGDQIVGVCSWFRSDRDGTSVTIRLAADETQEFSLLLADAMLTSVISECSQFRCVSLALEVPTAQIAAKEAAHGYGFRADASGVLRKLAGHAIFGPSSWKSFCAYVKTTEGLDLPQALPNWDRYAERQPVSGADRERRFLAFRDLESLLSPALFAIEGRPSLVVPIKGKYLERLLGSGHQFSFGPKLRAELSRQRIYLGDPRTLSRYTKDGLLFFYESGDGAKAIVAVARVVDAFLIRRDKASLDSLSLSVLTPETLVDIGKAEEKAACLFESPLWLPSPVPLKALRAMGIENGQLITAMPVSNDQIKEIFRIGGVA